MITITATAGPVSLCLVDVRQTTSQRRPLPPDMPWGQVPVLYVNGEPLAQTVAICRYLAELYSLRPATGWLCARADAVAEAVSDITDRAAAVRRATDPETKAALRAAFLETRLPQFLTQLERQLTGEGFLCGQQVRAAPAAELTRADQESRFG